MRVVPPYRRLGQALPRRLRWTRAEAPRRRRLPRLYRPAGRTIERPSARVSLLHLTMTLAVVLTIWSLGALFQSFYAGRIYPHVAIDHVPVGGMTRDEAIAALQETEAARVNQPIFVEAGENSWQVTPAQFGTRYDVASAVDRALALAHTGPLFTGGWNEFMTIVKGANLPLSGTYNRSAVARFLLGVAHRVYVPSRRAVVGVRGDDVAILRAPAPGRRLDPSRAATTLGSVVETHDTAAVTLPLQPVDSALGYAQANQVLSLAHRLLGAPIQIKYNSGIQTWLLKRQGLLRLLTFTPDCATGPCRFDLGIDAHKLARAFEHGGVTSNVDSPPVNATFQLVAADDPRKASVVVLAETIGQAIDADKTAREILSTATAPLPHIVYLITDPLYPSLTAAQAEALNFQSVVGTATIHVDPALLNWARMRNLNVATYAISNTLVRQGQTFSLAEHTGPRTVQNAYAPGQNVSGPDDITGANGGVNNAATVLMSALLDAGLPVGRVQYPYLTLFAPPGLDAMVSYGQNKRAPDLTFKNTTDHPVLIMTSNDQQGGITMYIFNAPGYAPGHQSGSYTSTVANPDITLNPDGSVDTTIRRTITTSGGTTQDSLPSHYRPIDP